MECEIMVGDKSLLEDDRWDVERRYMIEDERLQMLDFLDKWERLGYHDGFLCRKLRIVCGFGTKRVGHEKNTIKRKNTIY